MNNDIEIKSIETKETNNLISVEIKDETEFLIAAHNTDMEAHNTLIKETEAKINALNGTINEIEDNMVSISNLPKKLSDLENDTNFVSEETLINAIETRGLINNTTLNETEAKINNLITTGDNALNTKIENLKTNVANATDPSFITSLCMPSNEQIILIPSPTTGEYYFTMPADGVLHARGRARTEVGILIVTRTATDTQRMLTVTPKDHPGSFELLVNKDEVMKVWTQNFTIDIVKFSYLNGTVPETEEEAS